MALPVLCYHPSDACIAQLESAIFYNDDDFFKAIDYYIKNKNERINLGLKTKENITKNYSYDSISDNLFNALNEACINFKSKENND